MSDDNLIEGRRVKCRNCGAQLEIENGWHVDPVIYSCPECDWTFEKPNPYALFSQYDTAPEDCECGKTSIQGHEGKKFCYKCSSHGLLKHQSSSESPECSDDYCKTSPTSYHRCKCDCGGSNHGDDLHIRHPEVQHLRTGDINLLENRKFGGDVEVAIETLDGKEFLHQCRENESAEFTVGCHTLIYGRITEKGSLKDKSGRNFLVYTLCPKCATSLKLFELANEDSSRDGDCQ